MAAFWKFDLKIIFLKWQIRGCFTLQKHNSLYKKPVNVSIKLEALSTIKMLVILHIVVALTIIFSGLYLLLAV